jgi:hypothetical protein
MKLEADLLRSLEKDSHYVRREESHKSGLLTDWKIKESIATHWLLITGSDKDETLIREYSVTYGF